MLKKTLNRVANSAPAWIGLLTALYLCSLAALVDGFSWIGTFIFWAGFVGWMVPWQFSPSPCSATARLVKYFWFIACVGALLVWQLGVQLKSDPTFDATLSWLVACFWLGNPLGTAGFLVPSSRILDLFRSKGQPSQSGDLERTGDNKDPHSR
ncbi:hypothetical protein [Pseudomonas guariconensis]|uniref:hypothetical protein n=1 Tax=Pseudomonas guariconensis TaxID=1288410 RepID=UPI00390690FC